MFIAVPAQGNDPQQTKETRRTSVRLDNDPYQEHDFGVTLDDRKLFWKIDYFDKRDPDLGAENPADAETTERVLTLMLAEEY